MGRPKYIETPNKLWDLFLAYKKQVKENPVLVKDWVGKDANPIYREKEKPLTMVGFECFVMDNSKISCPDLTNYFEGKESYKDYFPIASRIKKEIESDQITGGMTMIYSQSITARINGLTEKQDHTTNGKEMNTNTKLSITLPNGKEIDDFKLD